MGRLLVLLVVAVLPIAAQLRERSNQSEQQGVIVEEDEDLLPQTVYVFNPIQAKKDLKIGDFYAKRGNHRAAVGRYLEATKWNPSFADAYFRLAQSREKLDQPTEALEAYRKFLELDSDGGRARQARKRVAELEAEMEKLPLAAEQAKDASETTSKPD